LLMYLRLGVVFCLKTTEPYSAQFRARDSSDDFELRVREHDVYTLNQARAHDYSHKITSTNPQGDAKIALIVGYFHDALEPLTFPEQKKKWPTRLHWTQTKTGIWPTKPKARRDNDNSDIDSTEDASCTPPTVTRFARLPEDELAFAMTALTGQKTIPRSFEDWYGDAGEDRWLWHELLGGLRKLHQGIVKKEVPPIDFGKVLQECLFPVAGVRPTADLIMKATHKLSAISEGAVIWWQATHLFDKQPTCVTAADACAAWGLDSGEHYI